MLFDFSWLAARLVGEVVLLTVAFCFIRDRFSDPGIIVSHIKVKFIFKKILKMSSFFKMLY